jgi:uncharacterized protein
MLVVLPPSETKRPPPVAGAPFEMGALSFPELVPLRRRVLDALIETSGRPDAFSRLRVRPSLAGDVLRNLDLPDLPARPASEVYSGPLHAGLDAPTLSPNGVRRLAGEAVIVSALWGALRPRDRIPPYRLDVCSNLAGMDRLEPTWRTVLPELLGQVAGPRGVVVDLRSPSYQALGMPSGVADRTVAVHVRQQAPAGHYVGDVVAKRIRGQAARLLLESGADPLDPIELAAVLGERWPLELRPPERPGRSWRLSLQPDA